MINFKKAVSVVVLFSFILCSCGKKSPLRRDNDGSSLEEAPPKDAFTSKFIPCCYHRIFAPYGVRGGEGQCMDPTKTIGTLKCYNIVPPEKIPICCLGNLGAYQCAETGVSSCYVNMSEYTAIERVDEIKEIFYEYGEYDAEIQALWQKLSDGSISTKETLEKMQRRIEEIPNDIKKAFREHKKDFYEHGYDTRIQKLKKNLSDGTMSVKEVIEELDKRVKEISKTVEIKREVDFNEKVLSLGKIALVYFFATNCKYCASFTPIANELAFIYSEDVRVYKVNVNIEENYALLKTYEVNGWPTLFLFEDGKDDKGNKVRVHKQVKNKSIDNLKTVIKSALGLRSMPAL